jgi:hypothetical protein
MLVKWKIVGGSTYALLFDESAGDANEKFAPSFRDSVFKAPGYGAPNVPKVPLSNTDGQTQFRWSSNYSTADAGLTAIQTFRATFKGVSVHLQVTVGSVVMYLPNANLSSSSHDQKGREVLHTATFDHDDIQSAAP